MNENENIQRLNITPNRYSVGYVESYDWRYEPENTAKRERKLKTTSGRGRKFLERFLGSKSKSKVGGERKLKTTSGRRLKSSEEFCANEIPRGKVYIL